MINKTEYLGDGVYVKFDGYYVWLLANCHTEPTDYVGLEPEVLDRFLSFAHELKEFIAQYKQGESHE